MSKRENGLLLFRRCAGILVGTALVAVAGVYFFHVGAGNRNNERLRLWATGVREFGSFAPKFHLTSNPDGSGSTVLSLNGPMPSQPAWSPDGTKSLDQAGRHGCICDQPGWTGQTNLTNTASRSANQPIVVGDGKDRLRTHIAGLGYER
jgi:hypothetical protein